jgi:ABC-type phosphate transport system substrate-binding protein
MLASPSRTASRRPAPARAAVLVVAGALLALATVAIGLLSIGSVQAAPAVPPFHVIVNPANPATVVDRAFVAQAFLKKVRRWPDGQTIYPVDLTRDSAVRRQWSVELLGRSVEAVKNYWQQLIFAGRDLPPPEMPSENEVVTYVLHNPGAIGYISGAAPLHGAKVLGFQ